MTNESGGVSVYLWMTLLGIFCLAFGIAMVARHQRAEPPLLDAGSSANALTLLSPTNNQTLLTIWDDGPATGTGRPCQIFVGSRRSSSKLDDVDPAHGDITVTLPNKPNTVFAYQDWKQTYKWVEADGLPDGQYLGMLDVRNGRVQTCP